MYWLRIALFSIIDREEAGSNNYIIAKYLLENFSLFVFIYNSSLFFSSLLGTII